MRHIFRLLSLILIFSAVAFLLGFARVSAEAPPGTLGFSVGGKTFYIPQSVLTVLRDGWGAMTDLGQALPACIENGLYAVGDTVGRVCAAFSECFSGTGENGAVFL